MSEQTTGGQWVTVVKECEHCHGTGKVPPWTCWKCNGTGKVPPWTCWKCNGTGSYLVARWQEPPDPEQGKRTGDRP